MGRIASCFDEDEEADARPFGRCESGTRIGLCRRIERFFCDFPMTEDDTRYQKSNKAVEMSGMSMSTVIQHNPPPTKFVPRAPIAHCCPKWQVWYSIFHLPSAVALVEYISSINLRWPMADLCSIFVYQFKSSHRF